MIRYKIQEYEIDLDEKEIILPPVELKIIEVFYRVHAKDNIRYNIGSIDRLILFIELKNAFIKGTKETELDKLKLQYGFYLANNNILTGNIKKVIRLLILK